MCIPFIRNHQYNFIKKQSEILLQTIRTVADQKIVQALRGDSESKIIGLFPNATEEQKKLLEPISVLQTVHDFDQYLFALKPYLMEFPTVTPKQIQKLFPKNKKLRMPDLATIDHRFVTYLGWNDIGTNKLFILYPMDGQIVGLEGRFTPTNRKNYCFLCNRYEELALFTAITKKRPINATSDYYKAVGNYLCMDSQECNKNIRDTTALEKFIHHVMS
ncbi:FusB/FusC family EF-G-binding protein [Paenibacillus sp. N1-5-1-14]|uniref:FusB/FusC family EF-G-binding protein n=1 Tax=Paenibacillus radicibacter TaxID=2972488 RepID=UPI002158CFC0|nr:FusB/FusC family EF-G-binding protein [Paenibacillus radicibacter]MCR8645691.1 FusB/FusC family EF-G-binding protein [Paenibacillus radicibacter]